MQQTWGENKLTLGETKLLTHILVDISLQPHKTLVWTIDITYFQSAHPKYGEACGWKKVIVLMYNMHS